MSPLDFEFDTFFCFCCPTLSDRFSGDYLARRQSPAVMNIYPFQGIFYLDFISLLKFVRVSQKKLLTALRILKKALHLARLRHKMEMPMKK